MICGRLRTFTLGIILSSVMLSVGYSAPQESLHEASQFAVSNNEFAISLLREIEKDNGESNCFYSPLSIASALMLALEGARGETALEMGKTLKLPENWRQEDPMNPWTLDEARKQIRSIMKGIPNCDASELKNLSESIAKSRRELADANKNVSALAMRGDWNGVNKAAGNAEMLAAKINRMSIQANPYELRIANSMWIERSMPRVQSFIENTKTYQSELAVKSANFKNRSEEERQRINQWIASETRNKIRDLFDAGSIRTDTRIVLANAVYFRGTWRSPFPKASTKFEDFHLASGEIEAIPMMHQSFESAARYAAFHGDGSTYETPTRIPADADPKIGYPGDDGFLLLELPYNGEGVALSILIPRTPNGLPALVSKISAESLENWHQSLVQREVRVAIPKFRMDTNLNLKSILVGLGMEKAFSPIAGVADFGGISRETSDPLFLSQVSHRAMVEVNEEGTEAAAATGIGLDKSPSPSKRKFIPEFRADHPFLFMIRDSKNG